MSSSTATAIPVDELAAEAERHVREGRITPDTLPRGPVRDPFDACSMARLNQVCNAVRRVLTSDREVTEPHRHGRISPQERAAILKQIDQPDRSAVHTAFVCVAALN
jgi:hypothetical protein